MDKRLRLYWAKNTANLLTTSVTKMGDFLKILGDQFSYAKAQLFVLPFGLILKHHFKSKNGCGYILDNFWKILITFYYNIWSHWSRNLNSLSSMIFRTTYH